MQNRLTFEIEFRMNRLSVRLERLAAHFEELAQLLEQGAIRGIVSSMYRNANFLSSGRGLT
jgi:hypothetical protein